MKKPSPRTEPGDEESKTDIVVDAVNDALDRNKEWSKDRKVKEALEELYNDIEKGFRDQEGRSDDLMEYWDIYNCELTAQQFYSGNSRIYVPIVLDAIKARKTRFTNQLFPQSGRNVEATAGNGDIPHAEIALIESYIRKSKMRTQVVPALLKNGDIEGHYTVYASWAENTREVAWKHSKPPMIDGAEAPDGEEILDVETKVIHDGFPQIEVIADSDLLVLPQTADSLREALADGGSVTIIRRWSKAKILEMRDRGLIRDDAADELIGKLTAKSLTGKVDKEKDMVDAAGIKGEGRGKHALVYETWHLLTVEDKRRIYRTYFGGEKATLGCKRNPYWSDRLPIFSAPVEKVQGAFKGKSQVEAVATLQYQANDAANEAMDSAAYALMPIIMTDPEKNPRVGSMILSLAAVWEVSPNDTKFAEMPPLWKEGLEIVATVRQQIFQTLSVNAAQITQSAGTKKKPGQAEIANEQQIDILTTNDAVTIIEEEILTPLVSFMLEMDHQFRDDDMLVRGYGPLGMQTELQKIPPIQMDNAYAFRWFGVEQARNAQQIQQQIATINVLRGIPPQSYKGYTMDLGPAISQLVENSFGPRLGPLTFKSVQDEMSIDPEMENMMLLNGFVVPTHMGDDPKKHVEAHMKILQQDQHGTVKIHLQAHMQAMAAAQSQQQQATQPGQPGAPGGGGQPGAPGTPRMGAQPTVPKGVQQPPGAIHPDQMKDPRMMPRQ